VQKLQVKMAEVQEELARSTVTATAGGGAVRVVMNGQLEVQSVEIAPEAVDAEDIEMLQDLILVAMNEAIESSQGLAAERMGELTGGLGLPGIL
jgi:DNA-binding YbaB/EbfC family protein